MSSLTDPCFGEKNICALRLAVLDANGRPDNGSQNGWATNSIMRAVVTPQVSEGEDLEQKNGCGDICISAREEDIVKRVQVELEFCRAEWLAVEMMCGGIAVIESPSTDPMGYLPPYVSDGGPGNGVCLEFWTQAADGSGHATADQLGGALGYWHYVFPKFKGRINNRTHENAIGSVPIIGFSDENLRITANGPFDDWPLEYAQAMTNEGHPSWGVFLQGSIPTTACAPINVPSAAS